MKFKVEDQYPEKWVNPNLQEAPLPNCKLEAEEEPFNVLECWTIEVGSLEDLIALAKWKVENDVEYHDRCSIFINVKEMRIVFTTQDVPE